MLAFSRKVLALDMGNHSYKIIAAVKEPDIRILHYDILPWEEVNGTGNLIQLLRKLRYHSMDTVLSFHHKSMVIREIKLKGEEESRFPGLVREEMSRYQVDLNEKFDYDYLLLPERDRQNGQHTAVTAAVSRSVNREYIDRAIRLGFRLTAVDVQIHAFLRVFRCLMDRCRELPSHSAYLMLDLGYDNTTVAIAYRGRVFAPRMISIGCRCLEGESMDLMEDYLIPILRSCSSLMDTFTYSHAGIPLQQAIAYGGGVYAKDVCPAMQDQISIKLSDMNEFRGYFPEIPSGMDLNLYGNCLGSVLWKENAE